MFRTFLVALVTGAGMFIRASADPEIGQAISGFKKPIIELDNFGDDSVEQDCRKGETAHFTFDAGFRPGVKGRFAQIASSLARLKLTDGNVIRGRGFAVNDSRRLLAFTLPALDSGRKVSIDPSGNNYVPLTVRGVAGPSKIKLNPVGHFCVKPAPTVV